MVCFTLSGGADTTVFFWMELEIKNFWKYVGSIENIRQICFPPILWIL